MISRKRKLEKAVLDAFVEWTGAAIDGVQVITGRNISDLETTQIRIHCNGQEPLEDISEYVTRVQVEGMFIVQQSVDDNTINKIEEVEAIVESFIEMTTPELLALINAETDAIDVTDIQPGRADDGIDNDLRRYLSTYTFTAFVKTIEPEEE
jgi:hypothetical protein